jgi:putative endonuclease
VILTVIYVTGDLCNRMREHKLGAIAGFTKRYNVKILVYVALLGSMEVAIKCEKQLMEWQRRWKIALIERFNPLWLDLCDDQCCEFIT